MSPEVGSNRSLWPRVCAIALCLFSAMPGLPATANVQDSNSGLPLPAQMQQNGAIATQLEDTRTTPTYRRNTYLSARASDWHWAAAVPEQRRMSASFECSSKKAFP